MLQLIQEFHAENKQNNQFLQEELSYLNFGPELYKKHMQNCLVDIKLLFQEILIKHYLI